MRLDVGSVLSETFRMVGQRLWLMLGLYAVYFVIQIVVMVVFGGSVFAAGLTGADPRAVERPSRFVGETDGPEPVDEPAREHAGAAADVHGTHPPSYPGELDELVGERLGVAPHEASVGGRGDVEGHPPTVGR